MPPAVPDSSKHGTHQGDRMHAITPEKLRGAIEYYRAAKELASRTEAELLHILIKSENHGAEIDGIKVLGLVRQAAADLRGLKAP